MQLNIYTTLLYLIYLGYAEFYELSSAKSLEIFNESIFVVIQYNFVLLGGLVDDEARIQEFGDIIMYLIVFILAVNFGFILVIVIKQLIRKIKLYRMKK